MCKNGEVVRFLQSVTCFMPLRHANSDCAARVLSSFCTALLKNCSIDKGCNEKRVQSSYFCLFAYLLLLAIPRELTPALNASSITVAQSDFDWQFQFDYARHVCLINPSPFTKLSALMAITFIDSCNCNSKNFDFDNVK